MCERVCSHSTGCVSMVPVTLIVSMISVGKIGCHGFGLSFGYLTLHLPSMMVTCKSCEVWCGCVCSHAQNSRVKTQVLGSTNLDHIFVNTHSNQNRTRS